MTDSMSRLWSSVERTAGMADGCHPWNWLVGHDQSAGAGSKSVPVSTSSCNDGLLGASDTPKSS